MNTKDFLRTGIPLGQATRLATDFVGRFILGGGDKSRLHEEAATTLKSRCDFGMNNCAAVGSLARQSGCCRHINAYSGGFPPLEPTLFQGRTWTLRVGLTAQVRFCEEVHAANPACADAVACLNQHFRDEQSSAPVRAAGFVVGQAAPGE